MQIVFEPVTSFKVKVIGRLVEKKKVWLCQQQLCQRNPHLPAAAELVRLPTPVFFAKAESGQHAAHLGIQCIAVQRVKALLQH